MRNLVLALTFLCCACSSGGDAAKCSKPTGEYDLKLHSDACGDQSVKATDFIGSPGDGCTITADVWSGCTLVQDAKCTGYDGHLVAHVAPATRALSGTLTLELGDAGVCDYTLTADPVTP